MVQHTRKFIGILSTLTLMLVCSDALAGVGGTITYGPLPQSIPTLSGSMLAVLALLFAIVAFRVLRAHSASKPLAALVAVGVLAFTAASGNQLIQNAQATVVAFVFSSPGGGTVLVNPNSLQQGQNQSGQPVKILSVTPINSCYAAVSTNPNSPQCTGGLVLQNLGTCWVDFEPQPCG